MNAPQPTTPAVPPFMSWGWRARPGGGYIATCRSCWTDYRITGVATEDKLFEELGKVLCKCQTVKH